MTNQEMNEEIITRLQDLVDVCFHSKKLSIDDISQVITLIEKVKRQGAI